MQFLTTAPNFRRSVDPADPAFPSTCSCLGFHIGAFSCIINTFILSLSVSRLAVKSNTGHRYNSTLLIGWGRVKPWSFTHDHFGASWLFAILRHRNNLTYLLTNLLSAFNLWFLFVLFPRSRARLLFSLIRPHSQRFFCLRPWNRYILFSCAWFRHVFLVRYSRLLTTPTFND